MTGLLVVVGALVGAPLRLWVTEAAVRRGQDAAVGTLLVNVVGAAVLGALTGGSGVSAQAMALVGTGFCGTLTTFSTFGGDVVRLADTRRILAAVAYAVGTLLVGLAVAGGVWALAGGAGTRQ